jgi:RNA polymerase sigma-70 factor (ECF subfamily)
MSDYPSYFTVLYEESGGSSFGLSLAEFAAVLIEVSDRYVPGADDWELASFHRSLRVADLALARACAAGREAAWDYFVIRYRAKLYEAGAAIARDESVGSELADSLYTDLFGTRQTDGGQRISKLASYTGRGSLDGWLRTVLAQEYVNRYRAERRTAPFDESVQPAAPANDGIPVDPRLEQATAEAIAELPAEDRLTLAAYYLDGRTLAEIARMMYVHESTISRRLDRVTSALRKRILHGLRHRGMSRRAAEEALDTDVRDLAVDVRASLAQDPAAETFHERGKG